MDWYGIVCMYMGMCPFSPWFRYGFWWPDMVFNSALQVNSFLCIVDGSESGFSLSDDMDSKPWWPHMNVIKDHLQPALLANVAGGGWSHPKKQFHSGRSFQSWRVGRTFNEDHKSWQHPVWWLKSFLCRMLEITLNHPSNLWKKTNHTLASLNVSIVLYSSCKGFNI